MRSVRDSDTVLDEFDLRIIAELQNDVRRGYSEIASATGIHRNTVRTKLKRLMDQKVVTPSVYVDPRTLGYRAPAIIGVKVAPGEIERVATKLATFTNIHHVFVCLGRYDVVLAGSLFRDEDELLSFMTNEVGRTPGVMDVETMITVGLTKLTFGLVNSSHSEEEENAEAREAIHASLDKDDYAIIRELQRDPRRSAFSLAAAIGMSRNTVASKLRRLLDYGIVRAVAIADPAKTGYKVVVMFGMSVLPGQADVVAERLRSIPSLQSTILCIGRYSIVTWCLCRDLEELNDLIMTEFGSIPGVRDVDAMVILRTKKTSLAYLT